MQSPGIVLLPLIHFPLHTDPIPKRLCMELLQYIISFPFPFILINFTLFSYLRTFQRPFSLLLLGRDSTKLPALCIC